MMFVSSVTLTECPGLPMYGFNPNVRPMFYLLLGHIFNRFSCTCGGCVWGIFLA